MVGIRQIGCQTNEEDRTVDIQTDEIGHSDKSMQFYLGDDTDFLEALKAASSSRKGKLVDQLWCSLRLLTGLS